jgi:hypothetical protein
MLDRMASTFNPTEYNVLINNCRSFCDYLLAQVGSEQRCASFGYFEGSGLADLGDMPTAVPLWALDRLPRGVINKHLLHSEVQNERIARFRPAHFLLRPGQGNRLKA